MTVESHEVMSSLVFINPFNLAQHVVHRSIIQTQVVSSGSHSYFWFWVPFCMYWCLIKVLPELRFHCLRYIKIVFLYTGVGHFPSDLLGKNSIKSFESVVWGKTSFLNSGLITGYFKERAFLLVVADYVSLAEESLIQQMKNLQQNLRFQNGNKCNKMWQMLHVTIL